MTNLLLAALLTEWINRLSAEIDRLDAELPLARKCKVGYRYNKAGPFDLGLMISLQDHPEKFTEYKTELPHTELDTLRQLLSTMTEFVEELRSEPSPACTICSTNPTNQLTLAELAKHVGMMQGVQ
jgi:hypothetical protein